MSDPLTDIAALLTEGQRVRTVTVSPKVDRGKPRVEVEDLVTLIATAPKVQVLAMGQTSRSDGYATEAQYLAACRRPEPMRMRDVAARQSHRRWDSPVTTLGELLEGAHRRWGDAEGRRQYARAQAARLWYGCPNISLG